MQVVAMANRRRRWPWRCVAPGSLTEELMLLPDHDDHERARFEHDQCSRWQQQSCRARRPMSSLIIILVIRLFAIHSLLCLSLCSVALETEAGLVAHVTHRDHSSSSRSTPPPPHPSPGNNTGNLQTLSPAAARSPSPSHMSAAPRPSPSSPAEGFLRPEPSASSPAMDPPAAAQSASENAAERMQQRFNGEEKAGITLAAFAAVLQVAVVAYLLAKRRQMLGIVCDYDRRRS